MTPVISRFTASGDDHPAPAQEERYGGREAAPIEVPLLAGAGVLREPGRANGPYLQSP